MRRERRTLAGLLVAGSLSAFSLFAFSLFAFTLAVNPAPDRRVAPAMNDELGRLRTVAELQRLADAGERVRVIVEVAVPTVSEGLLSPSAVSNQRATISTAQQQVLRSLATTGATVARQYATIPFLAIEVDAAALRALRSDARVQSIRADELLRPLLVESLPLINAPVTLSGATFDGQGYAVAVLDTGVGPHPFLNAKIVAEACFSTNFASVGATSLCPNGASSQLGAGAGVDCSGYGGCGHGTHVAGIAAGASHAGQPSPPFDGVARGAGVVAINVFTGFSNGVGAYSSDIIAGLEFVHELSETIDIAAANLSLGGSAYAATCDSQDPAMVAIVGNLASVNVATVAAAGNDGFPGFISFPACISGIISVGSTTKTDGISNFSNSGALLDLLAPGSEILSSIPGAAYTKLSGTSMATPHVAGAWAIMRQLYPNDSPAQILDRLRASGTLIIDRRFGTGDRVTPRLDLEPYSDPSAVRFDFRMDAGEAGDCRSNFAYPAGGEEVTLCFTLTNRGTSPLTSYLIESELFDPITGSTPIPPGESALVQRSIAALDSRTVIVSATASNGSGERTESAVAMVRPLDYRRTPNRAIDYPPGASTLFQDELVITDVGVIRDLELYLHLHHSWLGDLAVTLTHVESGVAVPILGSDSGYCGSARDVDAVFGHNAAIDPYVACDSQKTLASGPFIPDGDLSTFVELQGTWRLTIEDGFPELDGGGVLAWGLRVAVDNPSLLPVASDCGAAAVGASCTASLALTGYQGSVGGVQTEFAAPGFSVTDAVGIEAFSGCSTAVGGVTATVTIAAICNPARSADGSLIEVSLVRVEAIDSLFTTSDALIAIDAELSVPASSGALAVPLLTCSIADFSLDEFGDVNADQAVDIVDAVWILQTAVGNNQGANDRELYHADLNSDGVINVVDALIALRKAVDPSRPAKLEVSPRTLALAALESSCVLIGNSGRIALSSISVTAPSGVVVTDMTPSAAKGRVYHIFVAAGAGGTIRFDAGGGGSQNVALTVLP